MKHSRRHRIKTPTPQTQRSQSSLSPGPLLHTVIGLVAAFKHSALDTVAAPFADLSPSESELLWNCAKYTLGEVLAGIAVLANTNQTLQGTTALLGLFLWVVFAKFCRHSVANSVHTAFRLQGGDTKTRTTPRLAGAVALLNLADILLICKWWHFRPNVLLAIFGYETVAHYPATLAASVQFVFNAYEVNAVPKEPLWRWRRRNLRSILVAEFLLHGLNFALTFLFSVHFMYNYTFPAHMVPALYQSLRLAVRKARILLTFCKNELVLARLPQGPQGDCIICYDQLDDPENVRSLACGHVFHWDCLSTWLDYSPTCPVCRQRV